MSLRRLARNWNAFAREDPLWSILTWPDRKGNQWTLDEFLATGRDEVDAVLRRLREHLGIEPGPRALDFGCGVGRLTQALAAHFDVVHGVDVANEMIAHARRFDSDSRGGAAPRIEFHVNATADLARFGAGSFDFVYSSLTLQHVPPQLVRGYLHEFCRVLSPGGVMVFQVPERLRRQPNPNPLLHALGAWSARIRRRVRAAWSRRPVMDMHGVPREEVRGLLRAGGCDVLAVETSTLAGVDWESFVYTALRRA